MTLARKWVRRGWGAQDIHTCVCSPAHTRPCVCLSVCETRSSGTSLFKVSSPPPPLSHHTHIHTARKPGSCSPPPPPPSGLNRLAGVRASGRGGRNNPSTGLRERARALTLGDGCAVHGEAELGFLVLYRDEERREVAGMFLTQR
jgi:hypothetical protein